MIAQSGRGLLLWLGLLGYAFYLFGAALNVFFPLYVGTLVLAGITLIRALTRIDPSEIAGAVSPQTPVRLIGGYLAFVGSGLTGLWLVMWGAHVFFGRPTPGEPEAFKLVAALDIWLMAPALIGGGVLLWKQRVWGYVIAAIAAIQGALYLLVLLVNAFVFIERDLTEAPGEVPMWAALVLGTAAAATWLLFGVRTNR